MSNKVLINLGKPMVVLNGLVTDKNNYSNEQKIKLLKAKKDPKFQSLKNPKIIENSAIMENNNNVMDLSEEEEDENEIKVINKLDSITSKNQEQKRKKKNGESTEENNDESSKKEETNIISKSVNKGMFQISQINLEAKKKENKNKKNKTQNRTELKQSQRTKKDEEKNINNLIVSNFSDLAEISNSNSINDNKINIGPKPSKNNDIKKSRKKQFITQKKEEKPEIKVEYKEVPKAYSYEELIKYGKNNACTFITLFSPNQLLNIIEDKSQIFMLNRKLKKEKKENVIISNKANEIDLTKNIYYMLKNNKVIDLFKKLSPENNNILQYMPIRYTGINTYGYLNINYCTNNSNINKIDDEIHFITKYFNDKNKDYILHFRKYILNLSCFKSNETLQNDRDYNIYHIIIPKKSVNKININFNEETSLDSLISKLNCEYYFYCQRPGELLIVEPESILLSYYAKEKTGIIPFFEKNYLIMFWNKMNKDSFSDYLILQNICKNEKYKNFPIVNTLVNLVNKHWASLSNDIIKIILEIYNDMDNYENINKYINDINDNNIRFHKLFLNGIYLCQRCQQEIFNFYVYDPKHKSNNLNYNNHCDKNMIIEYENNNDNIVDYLNQNEGEFICINCAHDKKYFCEEKNIIFFKYTREELNNFISTINSKINSSRNKEKKEMKEMISANFNGKRKDDCINVDEFLLKIDGPLRILDKEYEKNKNDLLNKEIKVDKYLNIIGKKDNANEINNIDPLNPSNFRNDIQDKDIYEKLNVDYDYQMDIPYGLMEPKMMSSKQSQKNNMNVNFIPYNEDSFNFDNENKDNEIKSDIDSNINNKSNEKENKNNNNSNNKGSKKNKNKKKNNVNMADLISSGQF